ncbi:MAG TPA: hypothetical protein VH540_18360 [Ktedonobacterales bacterium]|jgi:hypothetical protein
MCHQARQRWEAALVMLNQVGERLYVEQIERILTTWRHQEELAR